MIHFIRGKIGVKVGISVNFFILLSMILGTYILIQKQSASLEGELLKYGQNQSRVGANMISKILEEAIDNNVFSVDDAFDTNYVPVGNFSPPKFHTKYDVYLDKSILSLQDEFLQEKSIEYAVTVDRNGYLPTHNSVYQQPITGDVEKDKVGNRTKRVFNDPVGLQAAQNTEKGFRQIYKRDTGATMWDISSPIMVKGKHWGGFRIGIDLTTIEAAKKQLMLTLLAIMGTILFLSILLTTIIVGRSLAPIRVLSDRADELAHGKNLQEEIAVTRHDEIGELQGSLNRLRMSMLIALRMKKKS
ncbi:MAG: HAMP domain-containing protein [Desulfocapsaceae bacterium]|nr:HAMP domain-containing protein [Desulfocapsaceae bacterium]